MIRNIILFTAAAALPALSSAQAQVRTEAVQQAELGLETSESRIPLSLSPEADAIVSGINTFAIDIYKASAADGSNLFISPASISTAMGLAYRGAAGETAEEIRKVMHYPLGPREFAAPNGEFLRTLDLRGADRELRSANALWIDRRTEIIHDYLADLDACCGAGLQRVDFESDPDAARLRINAWVEERTANRIRDLLTPDNVKRSTRAILVNTLYLKAAWVSPFYPSQTKTRSFALSSGRNIDVPLMQQQADYTTVSRGGVQGIALPFRGGELQMIILLPRSTDGLAKLERGLTAEALASWVSELDAAPKRRTLLTLPRFRLKWRADLKPALETLGMKRAASDAADFSLMSPVDGSGSDRDQWGLKISAVIHQTFLDVDEQGSEAASATAVAEVLVTGARANPKPPVIFRADHPFFLLIRDTRTDALLFMGRLMDPAAG